MIASNANPQEVSSESSNRAITKEIPTESKRIADAYREKIKSYKKFLKYQQRLIIVTKCVANNILLPSNKRHNTPTDLCLIIQQRRLKEQTLEYQKMHKQNLPYWKHFNDNTRNYLRNLKQKCKQSLKQKYNRLKPTAMKQMKTKNQKSKARWKKRHRQIELDAMRKKAEDVIVNKTDLVLDDSDKRVLLLGLSFIPTPKFSDTDLEKEWTELNQHIRRIEWENVYKDADQDSNPDEESIPPKLKFLKHNRPLPACIDEETNAYTDLCTAQLRNIKPKIKKQYEKNNNLTPELQASLKKLTDIAKRGKHVFCRSDKDGKIIIISRTDFDIIMTRELQKDKVQDLQTNDIDKHLQTIKNDMEEKVQKLHLAGGISDELLLHTIGLYTDENGRYCRVKKYAKYFTIGALGYSYPLFKTHKLNEQMIKETPSPHIPVRIVNAVSNITTSRCTAMLEAILKPISILYCGEEYTRDSSHYLEALISWKEKKIATQPLESQFKNLHLIAAVV